MGEVWVGEIKFRVVREQMIFNVKRLNGITQGVNVKREGES